MIFRNIDLPKLVYRVIRSNYAVRTDTDSANVVTYSLSNIYKFCICCVYGLQKIFDPYKVYRDKYFMIASCMPIIGQMENVLNYFYDPTQKRIKLNNNINYNNIYIYNQADTSAPKFYLYEKSDTSAPKVYFGYTGVVSNLSIIEIPKELFNNKELYSEFIATVNAIVMYGIQYKIIVK